MFNFTELALFPAAPETFLLLMIAIVLLADLWLQRAQLSYYLSQLAIVVCFSWVAYLHCTPSQALFSNHFIWDPLANLLKLAILIISFFAFIYARDDIRLQEIHQGEYYLLGLCSVLGMLVLVSGYTLLTLYLGLELVSLPLYALVALQRQRAIATEAAMKFIVLGALASALFLYGLSLLYSANYSPETNSALPILALFFLIAAMAFKLGAAPFHFWVPDVYQAASTAVTALISTAPKLAASGLIIRLLTMELTNPMGLDSMISVSVQLSFTVIAIISLVLGNCAALVQTNLKRLLAYSAIAHMGYVSLGLATGVTVGYAGAMFYVMAYALMALSAFGVLIALSRSGVEIENISDLRGLNTRSPWLAFLMLIVLCSMTGLPPMLGFFAKLGILEVLITTHRLWLASVAMMLSVIGAYYYLRIVKVMYFETPEQTTPLVLTGDVRWAINMSAGSLLLLGLLPGWLIEACRSALATLQPVSSLLGG